MIDKILSVLVNLLAKIITGYHIMSHDDRLSWILSLLFILGFGFVVFLGLSIALELVINLI